MVVPSEWPDNAPLTTLEAFSFGVPVLGTKEGGLPEILTPESGSMLFNAGNVRELSGLLVSLWQDKHMLRRMGDMARRIYEERFSPEAHIARYMTAIDE
jgi:glycosyltransferase involved in cell wall biosynthesis